MLNNDLKRMGKEASVKCFGVILVFPGGSEENHVKPVDIRPRFESHTSHTEVRSFRDGTIFLVL
jgi:hypothetical protein